MRKNMDIVLQEKKPTQYNKSQPIGKIGYFISLKNRCKKEKR
jgi:hypothetical protein